MKNFYALFIGIDAYRRVTPLNGCVNDALMMFEYLKESVDQQKYEFHPSFLLSVHNVKVNEIEERFKGYNIDYAVNAEENLPTRKGILQTLKSYQNKVAAGDLFFLFYAGHGSTEKAHPYFEEETGMLQTLVPRDARMEVNGKRVKDVLDKEIRFLLREISKSGTAENPIEIIFVQDSCHSAGATRSDLDQKIEEISNVLYEHEKEEGELFNPSESVNDYDDVKRDGKNIEPKPELDEDGMHLNKTEEQPVFARMVVADEQEAANYRAVEDFDFMDEEFRTNMQKYESLFQEEEEDKVRDGRTQPVNSEEEGARGGLSALETEEVNIDDQLGFAELEMNDSVEEEEIGRGGLLETVGRGGDNSRATTRVASQKPPFNIAYPEANHIHMSACGKAEYAYEVKYPNGQKGGVFTNTIISLLRKFKGNISYHDLFNAAKLHIDGQFKQSPSLYVKGEAAKRYEKFLGGYVERKEGIYNLSYKSKFKQWRTDVGAFLGLPVLRLNESIEVQVFAEDKPTDKIKAKITYVLAETAVVEFDGDAPNPNTKGLRVQIDPSAMTTQIPVAVEEAVAYPISHGLKIALPDDDGSLDAPYHLKIVGGKFRFYAKNAPSEYVDITQYCFENLKELGYHPKSLQLQYEEFYSPCQEYGIWELLQQIMRSDFSNDYNFEEQVVWYKLEFADGTGFFFDGEIKFLVDEQAVNMSEFLLAESKEVISLFLNKYFENLRGTGFLYLHPTVSYPNPFLAHLGELNTSFFQHYVKWVSPENAKYLVRVVNGRYYLSKTENPQALLSKGTENLDKISVAKMMGYLRTISRWEMLYALENPHPGSKQMLENLGLEFKVKLANEEFELRVAYSDEKKGFVWIKDQKDIEALVLDFIPEMGVDKDGNPVAYDPIYLSQISIKRSNRIEEQLFFGSLYLNYDFGIEPQNGVGSTEFFPHTAGKDEKVVVSIEALKQKLKIAELAEEQRPKEVKTAIKFFIAYNRFDVSDWVQEGIPLPKEEELTDELDEMRSLMGRKTNPRAGDCVVLTLPLRLIVPTSGSAEHKKPLDNHPPLDRNNL